MSDSLLPKRLRVFLVLIGVSCCLLWIVPAHSQALMAQDFDARAILDDLREQKLTQEQAAALYASLYVRAKLPFAQRNIFRLNIEPVSEDVSRSLPQPITADSLPETWRERWLQVSSQSIDPSRVVSADLRLGKVKDRSLLAQRLNRNAPLYQTKHFLIEADLPVNKMANVVAECELTYSIVSKLFNLKDQQNPLWIRVVRNRAAYVKMLKREVQQIGITNGYYDIGTNSVICYWDDSGETVTSLRHELTHLVLNNGCSSEATVDWKNQSDFWAFEAIATYVESLVIRAGVNEVCCMLGGWESPRLQPARYRRLHDLQWIAFHDLTALVRDRYQEPQDIQLRYSQSAGLAHLFMDSDEQSRHRFVNYVVSVHRGEPDIGLLKIESDEALRRSYDQFLLAAGESITLYALQPAREDIVLSRIPVESDDILVWPSSHRKLDWLDLSFTEIDGAWLSSGSAWDAKRLNVESTKVTDEDMPAVVRLASLEELDLSNCEISDVGVAYLPELKKLQTLWLSGTKITNSSAAKLNQITTLKTVDVGGTSVNATLFKGSKQ